MLTRMRRLPRHHMVTNNIGGQIGKSTLMMNIAGFLSASADASTVVLIDAASPEISVYECFENIFDVKNSGRSRMRYLDGSPYISAPKLEEKSSRNLLVVRPQREQIQTWAALLSKINRVQEHALQNGYIVTHVITETNLQPTDQSSELIFTELEYQALVYWTVWNRESLASRATYEQLIYFEETYSGKQMQFQYMHNPYQEFDEDSWDESDYMPSAWSCYKASEPFNIEPTEHFSKLCDLAQIANEKGLEGDQYWEFVYQDYTGDNGRGYRPGNLLPVFQRSREYNRVMPGKFAAIRAPLSNVTKLGELIDTYSNSLFSNVFQPFFARIIM